MFVSYDILPLLFVQPSTPITALKNCKVGVIIFSLTLQRSALPALLQVPDCRQYIVWRRRVPVPASCRCNYTMNRFS